MSRIFNIKVVEQPEARFTIKESYLFVFIALLFLLQLVVGLFSWSKIRRISTDNLQLRQEKENLISEALSLKGEIDILEQSNINIEEKVNNLLRYPENKLRASGINIEKKKIRKLAINGVNWENNQVEYLINAVYLTPEIADLSEYRRYVQIENPNYLMLEIEVKDLRNGGETRLINPYSFLFLKSEGNEYEAFIKKSIPINPQEVHIYYSGFYINNELDNFIIKTGNSGNPIELPINFLSSKTELLFGVFKLDSGFTSEYFD